MVLQTVFVVDTDCFCVINVQFLLLLLLILIVVVVGGGGGDS